MNSGKLKKSWPKFKDEKAMKWAEVYKQDKQGNHRDLPIIRPHLTQADYAI